MKVTVLTGIISAIVWIIIKMVFFYTMPVGYDIVPLVLLNMFCLLAAISIGLYIVKLRATEEHNALGDIKNGMTAGVPYALIVGGFLYFYYAQIDPEYNAHQLAEAEYTLKMEMDKPGKLAEIKEQNADFEVLSKDEIFEKIMSGYRSSLNPKSTFTLSLLGLVLMSALNSIFITIIFRRVIFRTQKFAPNTDQDTIDQNNE